MGKHHAKSHVKINLNTMLSDHKGYMKAGPSAYVHCDNPSRACTMLVLQMFKVTVLSKMYGGYQCWPPFEKANCCLVVSDFCALSHKPRTRTILRSVSPPKNQHCHHRSGFLKSIIQQW